MTSSRWQHSFRRLIWLARVVGLLLLATVAVVLDMTATERHRAEVRQQWQERLDGLSLRLQSLILQNIQTVWGVAANVAVDPDIDDPRFQELASVVFRLAPELKNIGLAPDFVIRHIYPVEGNRTALGLNIAEQSLSSQDIALLKSSRNVVFTGPIQLVQGGTGLAGRIPIHRHDTDAFWGVVSVILDLEKLYTSAGLTTLPESTRLALSRVPIPGQDDATFFRSGLGRLQHPVVSTLSFPGLQWTLFAEPVSGWPSHPESPWLFRGALALAFLLATLGLFWLTYLMLREQAMQRRFAGLFELSPTGIGLYDSHTLRRLAANPAHLASFGEASRSLVYFNHPRDGYGGPAGEPIDLRTRLRASGTLSGVEGYYRCQDGQLRPFLLKGLEMADLDQGSVIWLITEDMTEYKRLDEMKNQFISTVSHELRTPLTSISAALGLMVNDKAGPLPDKARELANLAHRNSQQLTFLINDLLDIEKLAAGKMTFQCRPWRLTTLLAEARDNMSVFAHEYRVQLALGDVPEVLVLVDRQRFGQALANLLSNAIKFSRQDGTVYLHAEHHPPRVRVYVRDHGEGIPDAFRERIFEKFSQSDASDRRRKGGTGLGLAITREIIGRMGGSVEFESVEGQGALFWLEIPTVETVAEGNRAPRRAPT